MNNEPCPMCNKHHDQTRPCFSPEPLPPVRVERLVRHPKVGDVLAWRVERGGIGHIVLWTKSHWTMTACGTWGSGDTVTKQLPKRICSKCRSALKQLSMPNKEVSDERHSQASNCP
jgi:hypothetical protein